MRLQIFGPQLFGGRCLERSDTSMKLLGKLTAIATALVCMVALVISIYPGALNQLLFVALVLAIPAASILAVMTLILVVFVFIRGPRGGWRAGEFPWRYATVTLLMLITTYCALRLYIPRRVAFAACRSSFQRLVDEGAVNDREFNRRIGPYRIDECLVDERGGTYFRVYSSLDGIGPDEMSYGFCHEPNPDGSPFGAADYQTFRLGNGWYWFRASNDW